MAYVGRIHYALDFARRLDVVRFRCTPWLRLEGQRIYRRCLGWGIGCRMLKKALPVYLGQSIDRHGFSGVTRSVR
jgi:hypothetical protein